MIKLKVNGAEYNLKFGYRVLAKTGLVGRVIEMRKLFSESGETTLVDNMPELVNLTSDLVLAGLQKFNPDYKVDYDDSNSVKEALERLYDFMDDYMDDPDTPAVIDLFSDMVEELIDNGFLSKKSLAMEKAATEQDATVIPMDHKKAEN